MSPAEAAPQANLVAPPTLVIETPDPARVRTPSDILRLVVAAVVVTAALLVEWLTDDSIPQSVAELLRGLDITPKWLVTLFLTLARILAAVLMAIWLVSVVRARRWRNLMTALFAAALAVAATELTNRYAPAPAREVIDLSGVLGGEFPPTLGLAAAAAVVTASAPWLGRTWRRVGWAAVLALGTARFFTTPISFETERAILLGWLAGAVSVVILGGPSRRPRGTSVAAGLAEVGVPLVRLEQAKVDARGSVPYFAQGGDGRTLFVKVLGQDERSADLLFRIYRFLSPRGHDDGRPSSSLRRSVEHEALVALAAGHLRTRTPQFVAFASAHPNAFVLVYEAIDGRSLDRLDPEQVTDGVLRAVWDQVAELRSHRIAHRDLRAANVFLDRSGQVWLIDFGFSELAASQIHLAADLAELLASTTLIVGPRRAVAAGVAVVGAGTLSEALARLRPWALSGASRSGFKAQPGLLAELRHEVSAQAAQATRAADPDRVEAIPEPGAPAEDVPPGTLAAGVPADLQRAAGVGSTPEIAGTHDRDPAAPPPPDGASTTSAPVSTAKRVRKAIVSLVVLGLIFWYVFDHFAGAAEVLAALQTLEARAFAVLLAATAWNLFTYWLLIVAATPGLSIPQAAVVNQSSTAVANVVPAGGAVALGLTYSMLTSWGFANATITLSVLVSGIWNTFVKLGMPILALAAIGLSGKSPTDEKALAILGLGLLVAAILAFALMMRSPAFAQQLGDHAARVASAIRRRLGRVPVTGWGDSAVAFRDEVIGLVRPRWLALTVAALVSHLSLFLVLLACLRALGVSAAEIPWQQALFVFAVARLATAIKLTPGGVGVIELVLIAGLTAVGGNDADVVAAVLLFRLLTYALPIGLGGLTYLWWRSSSRWRVA